MKKFYIIVLIIVLIITGCAQQREKTNNPFTLGVFNMTNIDPANGYDGWSTLRYGIGETLFILDDELNPIPKLAEKYSISSNGYTWEIILRDGIKFHNGKRLDGVAVKECLERTVRINERAKSDLNIDEILAVDNRIQITTKDPNPTLINSLCDPYACIIDVNADVDQSQHAIGTGPYMVDSFNEKIQIELNSFDEYWGSSPKCATLIVRNISDVDTLSMAMQNGELDVAYGVPYDSLDLFRENEAFSVSQTATTRVYMLYYNLQKKWMEDINVRKAISLAVDKDSYANVLLNKAGTVTDAIFPSFLPYGKKDEFISTEYNLEAAKALLKKSGYIDTNGDGWLDKNGEKMTVKLVTYSRTGLPIIAEAIQSALIEIGIDVQYELTDNISGVLSSENYDICAYASVTTPTGDPYNYLYHVIGTGQGNNFGFYSNKQVDALLKKMEIEFDPNKRNEYAIEIQKLALDDYAYNFLLHLNMALVMKSDVVGIKQSPVDYYIITSETGKE